VQNFTNTCNEIAQPEFQAPLNTHCSSSSFLRFFFSSSPFLSELSTVILMQLLKLHLENFHCMVHILAKFFSSTPFYSCTFERWYDFDFWIFGCKEKKNT
jgi:hypothetical protein